MKKIIVLTTATALLSSCGIYTKYQPAETTPDNLYGEEVAVDDTTNFGNVNWRELFTDPQLQALIEQGLQNNTDLRSAQLQIEEAEAYISSLEDLEACQDEVIPLYVATIRSVEVEGDTEKHKELTLSPFFLSKDSSLNLSNERKGIANNINGLKKTSIR